MHLLLLKLRRLNEWLYKKSRPIILIILDMIKIYRQNKIKPKSKTTGRNLKILHCQHCGRNTVVLGDVGNKDRRTFKENRLCKSCKGGYSST